MRSLLALFLSAQAPSLALAAQERDRVKAELFAPIISALERARAADAAVLAPSLFAEGLRTHQEAEQAYHRGERLDRIRERVARGSQQLDRAAGIARITGIALVGALEARRQAMSLAFVTALPGRLGAAGRRLDEAILAAERGDLIRARAHGNESVRGYRRAVREALEMGPFRDAQRRLAEARGTMPRSEYGARARRLEELKNRSRLAERGDIEVATWVASTLTDLSSLVSATLISPVSPIAGGTIPGVDADATGVGVTITNIDDNPRADMILMAYATLPSGDAFFRYRVGWNLDTGGNSPNWSEPWMQAPGAGPAQGAGVGVTNVDGNDRPDMVLMAYASGRFRYRIGWNLGVNGVASSWSEPIVIDGVGDPAQGAGIAVGNLDTNPRPDLVLAACFKTETSSYLWYRIAWNLNGTGQPMSVGAPRYAPGLDGSAVGAGVALAGLDANARPDFVVMAYGEEADDSDVIYPDPAADPDNQVIHDPTADPIGDGVILRRVGLDPPNQRPQNPIIKYRIGWNLGGTGETPTWSPVERSATLGKDNIQGADVALHDFDANGATDYVFAIYEGGASRMFRYWVKGAGRVNTVLTSHTVRDATQRDIDAWRFVRDHQMGVDARDFLNHEILHYPAVKSDFNIPNWYPMTGFKEVFVGTLDNFFQYNADFQLLGFEDHDLIMNIGVDDRFRAKFDFETTYPGGFLHSENEPHWRVWNKYPFNADFNLSPLEGRKIGIYGPYVWEFLHSLGELTGETLVPFLAPILSTHKEIHPYELIWNGEEIGGQRRFSLIVVQDNSRRFDSNGDFDFVSGMWDAVPVLGGGPEPGWQPWAMSPRAAEFRIAFELDPNRATTIKVFRIAALPPAYGLISGLGAYLNHLQDSDDGHEHALEYDGKILLRVREAIGGDEGIADDVGVTFDDVCRRPDGTLQGFLRIRAMVANDGDDAAYVTLRVTESAEGVLEPVQPPTARMVPQPMVTARARVLPETMRALQTQDRRSLAGGVELSLTAAPQARDADRTVSRVEYVAEPPAAAGARPAGPRADRGGPAPLQARSLRFTQLGDRVMIDEMPLLQPATLRVAFASGDSQRVAYPGLGLFAVLRRSDPSPRRAALATWGAFLRAAGVTRGGVAPPALPVFVPEARFDLRASYAPLKEGRVHPEEGSAVTKRLDEILNRSDVDQLQAVFASTTPFALDVSAIAINHATDERVPVRIGAPAAGEPVREPYVMIQTRTITRYGLQVGFPEGAERDLYEVVITVQVTDPFGHSHTAIRRVWSHGLAEIRDVQGVEAVLSTVASLTSVLGEDLVAGSRRRLLDDYRIKDDWQYKRARMVRWALGYALEDGLVTPTEFAGLMQSAAALRRVR